MTLDLQSVIYNLTLNAFNFELNAQQRFISTQRLPNGSFAGINTLVPVVDPIVDYTPGKNLSIYAGDLGLNPETESKIFSEIAENIPYELLVKDVF